MVGGTMQSVNLKLISLNIWGGYIERPLLEYIEKNKDVDIFCFQEVYHKAPVKMSTDDKYPPLDIYDSIQKRLPEHVSYFQPIKEIEGYGIAVFAKKQITVVESGSINVYYNQNYPGSGPSHSRDLQWLKCEMAGKYFYILNFHGLWNGKGKTDSKDRIIQSQKIKEFINSLEYPIVLCGDFNLRPDTESINILKNGMRDLIKEYDIKSTRTLFYKKPEKFADYIFISKDVSVNAFKVLEEDVSDHAPIFLSFSLLL